MKIIILLTMLLSPLVEAKNKQLEYGFLKQGPKAVAAQTKDSVSFSYDMRSSKEWGKDLVEISNLFPGYKSFETWLLDKDTNETIVYASEVAFVVDKVVDAGEAMKLSSADSLSEIDPGFSHTEITAEAGQAAYSESQQESYESAMETMGYLLKRKLVTKDQVMRMTSEAKKQLATNQAAQWCVDSGSTCIKSEAKFPAAIKAILDSVSGLAQKIKLDIPETIELYSQLSPDKSEGAYAGLEQVGFLANKFVVGIKNKILFHKLSDGKTLVTLETYAVLEKDDLDKFSMLGAYDVVLGASMFNTDEGLTMGFPLYAQKLAEALKVKLSQ